MFTLVPLVVLVIVGVVWATRSRRGPTVPLPAGRSPLDDTLRRWVAAGLLTAGQADAILVHEQPVTPAAARRRLPVAMEALAYLGGALGLVGTVLLVAPAWDDLPFGAHLAILGGAAAGFLVAGVALRAEGSAALERLREFIWLLATAATAGTMVVLGVDGFDLSERGVALLAAGGAGALSLALWRLRERPLQHLTTFVAGTVLAAVAASYVGDEPGYIGLAVFAVGLLWLLAARVALIGSEETGEALGAAAVFVGTTTIAGSWPAAGGLLLAGTSALAILVAHRALLRPDVVWTALGATGTMVGAAVVAGSWAGAAPLLGLAVAGVLAATGVTLHDRTVGGVQLALGLVGLFAFLPWTMLYWFGDALGPPAVLLVTGAALLAVAVLVLRRQGGAPRGTAGPSGSVRVA